MRALLELLRNTAEQLFSNRELYRLVQLSIERPRREEVDLHRHPPLPWCNQSNQGSNQSNGIYTGILPSDTERKQRLCS